MEDIISALITAIEERRADLQDDLENELSSCLADASKEDKFYELPVKCIVKIVKKYREPNLDVFMRIAANVNKRYPEEAVLLLNVFYINDFELEDFYKLFSCFKNSKALVKFSEKYAEENDLAEVDYEGELIKLRRQITSENAEMLPAAENGNYELVKAMIQNGNSMEVRDKMGFTPIFGAIVKNQMRVVQLLVDSGANTNAIDKFGGTPLHKAAEYDRVEAIKLLVRHGAQLEVRTTKGATPLHVASRNGRIQAVGLLLSLGANFNAENEKGETPLHLAISTNHIEVVQLLLDYGAKTNVMNKNGQTPRMLAASAKKGYRERIIALLDGRRFYM